MIKQEERKYSYRTVGIVGSSSFSLVLPKDYANNLGVHKGDPVKVTLDEGRLVVEKA
jgi:antitoxin component of MazEF toxin-antitoxin module